MRDLTLRGWQGWRVRPITPSVRPTASDRLTARGGLGPLELPDADGVRRELVERVKAAIAAGRYDTDDVWAEAEARLLERLDGGAM